MLLTVARNHLHEAASTVARAASTQSALPILTHILLTVSGDQLHLSATDQELSAHTSIPAQGALEEGIAVPARLFTEMLGLMPEGDVEIESTGPQQISLRLRELAGAKEGAKGSAGPAADTEGGKQYDDSKEIRYTLNGLPAEEFPSIPVVHVPGDAASCIRLPQSTLRRLLRQTAFAVSQDQTRVQYTGILFEREENVLRLVSTDGVVRIAVSRADLQEAGPALAAIVPARAVAEFTRLLKPDSEDEVTLFFRNDFAGPTLASFEANNVLLVTRLIEGQFAPWRRVVPNSYHQQATVRRSDLQRALRRMQIFARDDQNRVQLSLGKDSLQASCFSGQFGEGKERISALVEGEEMLIALHGGNLLEGIEALGEEGCRLQMTTSLSPCVLRPLEGEEFLYVQSPMHPR